MQLPQQPDFWRPQLMGAPVAIKVPGRIDDVDGSFGWVEAAFAAYDLAEALAG